MFDSVLDRGNIPKRRFGSGALISLGTHAAILAAVVWVSLHPHTDAKKDVDVTFFAPGAMAPPPPPPPPPPPAGGGASKPKVEKKKEPVKKPDTVVQPKEEPTEKPPEKPPPDPPKEEPAAGEGVPGGVDGGVAGGTVGGQIGGVLGGVDGGVLGGTVGGTVGGKLGGSVTMPFGEGMNRPTLVSGRDPVYTREALEAKVQGLTIVKCVITTAGSLQSCRIIKSLPFMDEAVLSAMATRHYTPITFQGQPVQVDYVFNIKLVLP